MSKLFTTVVAMFISMPAMAAPSACLKGIIEAQEWSELTSKQIECLSQAEEVKVSLAGLCSPNQKDFSAMYKSYREYEIAHKEAFEKMQAATDENSKNIAIIDVRQIEREWMVLGFKNEVATLLWPIWQVKSRCEGR